MALPSPIAPVNPGAPEPLKPLVPMPTERSDPHWLVLEDGSGYDIRKDLAEHGLDLVEDRTKPSLIPFKDSYSDFVVRTPEGETKNIDAYSYLANKGIKVDGPKTWEARKAEVRMNRHKMELEDDAKMRAHLDSLAAVSPETSQFAHGLLSMDAYDKQVIEPFGTALEKTDKKDNWLRSRTAKAFDYASLVPRAVVAMADDAVHTITGGKHGRQYDVSMARISDYGPDKVIDEQTGKERDQTISEGISQIGSALRMDPLSTLKDLGYESIRDPAGAITIAASALGMPMVSRLIPEERVAKIVATLARKYKPVASAARYTEKANKLFLKVSDKLDKIKVVGPAAKHYVEGAGIGGMQGVIANWALGSDKDAFRTFVREGFVEEGPFDLAVSGAGKATSMGISGTKRLWRLMSNDQKMAYMDKVQENAKANPEEAQANPASIFPEIKEEDLNLGAWDFGKEAAPAEEPAKPTMAQTGLNPENLGVTTVEGQDVPIDQPLPDNVSRKAVLNKRDDPTFKTREENADEREQKRTVEKAKRDVKKLSEESQAFILDHGKAVEGAYSEAKKEFQEEEKASDAEKGKAIEKAKTAITAILDPTKPTSFDDWNQILGQAYESIEDKRKAFAEFHVKEQKQAKAINEKVTPPAEGTAPTPHVDALTGVEPTKRFNAERAGGLKKSIADKLASLQAEKAAPVEAAPVDEGAAPVASEPQPAPDEGAEEPSIVVNGKGDRMSITDYNQAIMDERQQNGGVINDRRKLIDYNGKPLADQSAPPVPPTRSSATEGTENSSHTDNPRIAQIDRELKELIGRRGQQGNLGMGRATPAEKAKAKKAITDRIDRLEKEREGLVSSKSGPQIIVAHIGDKKPRVNVFDESRLDEIQKKLDEKLRNRLSANPMFDPELMSLAVEMGGIYAQKGINNFLDWSDKMIAAVGEQIKPLLKSVWEAVTRHPKDAKFDPELVAGLFEMAGILQERSGEDFTEHTLAAALEKEFGQGVFPYVASIYEALKAFPKEESNDIREGSGQDGSGEEADGGGDSEVLQGEWDPEGTGSADGGGGGDGTTASLQPEPGASGPRLKSKKIKGNNLDLKYADPIDMTPAKRREANIAAKEVADRLWNGGVATDEDREIMRQYTGIGGIDVSRTGTAAEDLHGVRYQHYTSYDVVKKVWRLIEALGFNSDKAGLTALEPAAGIGNFIGHAPRQIKWTAHEVDPTSGRILSLLYPANNANEIAPFETFTGSPVHMVVTNVPFLKGRGPFEYMEKNPKYKDVKGLHNYFIEKSLDNLHENGIGAFITSTGTMDAVTGTEWRKQLNLKNEVLTAMRLPEGTFKKNANYEGTVDLIVFRRRTTGEMESVKAEDRIQKDWVETSKVSVKTDYGGEGEAHRTKWYDSHPKLLLGEVVYGHNRGFTQTGVALNVPHGKTFMDEFHSVFMKALEDPSVKGAYKPKDGAILGAEPKGESAGAGSSATPYNGLEVKNGKVYRKDFDGELYPFRAEKNAAGKEWPIPESAFELLTETMELAQRLQDAIFEGRPQKFIQNEIKVRLERWKKLDYPKAPTGEVDGKTQRLLPGVVKKTKGGFEFGDRALEAFAAQDMRYHLLSGLYNNRKTGYSNALMDEVKVSKPVTTERGDMSTGAGVVDFLMKKYGFFKESEARAEFKGTPSEFISEMEKNPNISFDGEQYVHDNEFLTGSLWPKIDAAEAAGRTKEVEKLRNALPVQKTAQDVDATPHRTWWTSQAVSDFARTSGLDLGRGEFIDRLPDETGALEYRIGSFGKSKGRDGSAKIGDGTLENFVAIVLNQEVGKKRVETPEGDVIWVDDQATTDAFRKEWRDRFKTWARSPAGQPHAAEAAKLFNRSFASRSRSAYSTQPMHIEGYVSTTKGKAITPYPQQFAAVRRFLTMKRGMLAHGTGQGKTRAFVMATLALKNAGVFKKQIYSVPNAVLGMWQANFMEAAPGMKVKVIRGSDAATRIPDMQDAAMNDYDVILMTPQALETIPMKAMERYVTDDIAEHSDIIRNMVEAGGKMTDAKVKKISDRVDALTSKLRDIQEATLDPRIINFENWNADAIWVDEAHVYKNAFDILHEYGDKQFLDISTPSDLANDFQYKSRYINEKNGGAGIFLASATPTPNKPIEIYKVLKFIAPDLLKAAGLNTMDDFVRNFLEIGFAKKTGIDAVQNRSVEMVTKRINLNALRDLVGTLVDIRLDVAPELAALRPDVTRMVEGVPMSDQQQFGMAMIRQQAKMSNDDLMAIGTSKLKLTKMAQLLAIDPAMVYPEMLKEYPDFTKRNPKLGRVMEIIQDHHSRFPDLHKLVFLDTYKIRDVVPTLDKAGNKIPWPNGFGGFVNRKGTKTFPGWMLALSEDEKNRITSVAGSEPDMKNWPLKKRNGSAFVPRNAADMADHRAIFDPDGNIYVGERKVVANLHNEIADYAAKEIGIPREKIAIINGEQNKSDKEKAAITSRLENGEILLTVATRAAAGTGVELQARGDALIQVDWPWNHMPIVQADGRMERARLDASDDHPVSIYYMGVKGSLDAMMTELVKKKKALDDDLWVGNDDEQSNALENLEHEGINNMDGMLQVDQSYVHGADEYVAVKEAKKLNQGANKEKNLVIQDLQRSNESEADAMRKIENAQERIKNREQKYAEDLQKWEEKVKDKPELKKPEEPSHVHDQEIIKRNSAAAQEAREMAAKTEEKLNRFSQVSWEETVIHKSDAMLDDVKANRFRSISLDLAEQIDRETRLAMDESRDPDKDPSILSAKSKLEEWGNLVKSSLPDVSQMFSHLADMVATLAVKGKVPEDMKEAGKKITEFSSKYASKAVKAGLALVTAASAFPGNAHAAFFDSVSGPSAFVYGGIGLGVFYAYKKIKDTKEWQYSAAHIETRIKKLVGGEEFWKTANSAYYEASLLAGKLNEMARDAYHGLNEAEENELYRKVKDWNTVTTPDIARRAEMLRRTFAFEQKVANSAGFGFPQDNSYYPRYLRWELIQRLGDEPAALERAVDHLMQGPEFKDKEQWEAAAYLLNMYDNSPEVKAGVSFEKQKAWREALITKYGADPEKFMFALEASKNKYGMQKNGSYMHRRAPELPQEFYITRPSDVLPHHFMHGARAIVYRAAFGANSEGINHFLDANHSRFNEKDQAEREKLEKWIDSDLYDKKLKDASAVFKPVIRGLNNVAFTAQVGMNYTKSIPKNFFITMPLLYGTAGTRNFVNGMMTFTDQLVRGKAYKLGRVAGVISNATMNDVYRMQNGDMNTIERFRKAGVFGKVGIGAGIAANKTMETVNIPFFTSEQVLRIFLLNTFVPMAHQLYAEKRFKELSSAISPRRLALAEKNGKLSDEDAMIFGAYMTATTAGTTKVFEQPEWASYEWSQIAARYMRMDMSASKAIKNRIFLPMFDKSLPAWRRFGPMTRYLAASGTALFLAGVISNIMNGDNDKEKETVLDWLFWINSNYMLGIFGTMPLSVLQGIKYGTGLGESLSPVLQSGTNAAKGISDHIYHDKSWTDVGKEYIKHQSAPLKSLSNREKIPFTDIHNPAEGFLDTE